jgi:hypothetical protein
MNKKFATPVCREDYNIKIKYESEKSDLEDADWIQLATNEVQWWDFVNMMSLRIP